MTAPVEQRACTPSCWHARRCTSCGREMAPRGRSVGPGADHCECDGAQDARVNPRHLWDEHDSDRAYTDPIGWAAHVRACERCRGESND
jgi:hypothetical protein